MNVVSKGLCRADGKVYELLHVSGLSRDQRVAPCIVEGTHEAPLPCKLFELPGTQDAARRLVAVCPIVGQRQTSYHLGLFSPDGRLVEHQTHEVDFESAKWESRLNYRLHRPLCNEIRAYDASHENEEALRLEVTKVIGSPSHIIVRGSVSFPQEGDVDLRLLCLDDSLKPIGEQFVCMGSSLVPTRVAPQVRERKVQFSVHLPWNQERIHLLAYDGQGSGQLATLTLTRAHWERLLHESDWLFMHAGADPFYPEWFSAHRAKPYELAWQRRTSLPHSPLFSVIVPLFKTPESLFSQMLSSVLAQTYENWELILVNASPEEARLGELVAEAAQQDSRIAALTLEGNGGISLNTNAGIEAARGDFVCFFDHDDLLEPNLLFEYAKALCEHDDIDLLYCDEDKINPQGEFCAPYLKPDFNLDLLRCNNYICHMLTIRKSLLDQLKPNTPEFDGAQDHNLTLQAVERARRVWHVPHILYHWRITETSTAANADSKPYANEAGLRAVRGHLDRLGLEADVQLARTAFTYAVHYRPPQSQPLVSVIIPSCDHAEVLSTCITSILQKTTYPNYEIVVVENNSADTATFALYDQLEARHPDRIRVVRWNGAFNFSKIVNFGVEQARGDYLLLLNNDTEVITTQWMERMLGIVARQDVGAVGVRLFYPDDTIQHAGIVVTGKDAGHFAQDMPRSQNWGYFNLADCQRDLSAVTAACMMTKRSAFEAVGGFETQLEVAFNDVDYCLKLREKGLLVVYTPEVELYHYESLSRGCDLTEAQNLRNHQERAYLYQRWAEHYAHSDPYYTPNLRETIELARYYHF